MAFFDFFKRKKAVSAETVSVPEKTEIKPLHEDDPIPFPYRALETGLTDEQLISEWKNAFEEGVHPLIIQQDEQLMEAFSRAEKPLPQDTDKSFIREDYLGEIEEFLMDEESAPLIGRPDDYGEPMTHLFTAYDNRKEPFLLLSVPTERPWGVFRHVPFGGWNACPDAEKIADFCQMMYEDWGAVPLMVMGDTLVLLPGRIPTREEAYDLALKTYPFCPDLIMQEYGSVYALADALSRSTLWRFRWD
ncbi:MAG: DUF4253 domain-containing protein [Clostridia bacterium]|nr:DUF4253 domain-containing protein [Clostridia bacterium]